MAVQASSPVTAELQQEVEQFLYQEAWLLDSGQYDEWLGLFTDDVRYWIPIRETRQRSRDGVPDESELAVAHFDDDLEGLRLRVRRYDTGLAHVETPPSRTRHQVTNVVVERAGDELSVRSYLLLFQGRRDQSTFVFSAQRDDRIRRVGVTLRIAFRRVLLDHTVLPRALSTFF